eukprot:469250_1
MSPSCWFIQAIHLFVYILCIPPRLVLCGYPISDPYSDLGAIGKILPYNLISEERFQHILHHMHRMFPNQSLTTPLGYYFDGIGKDVNDHCYWPIHGDHCGSRDKNRQPLSWYSDANQNARFKQWDEQTCDQWWYKGEARLTCYLGLIEKSVSSKGHTVTVPHDRCKMFSDTTEFPTICELLPRNNAFCAPNKEIDRCWFAAETICGGNSCIGSAAHCDPIILTYTHSWAGHFDERVRVHPDFWQNDGKHFALWLEYHDGNGTQTPEAC